MASGLKIKYRGELGLTFKTVSDPIVLTSIKDKETLTGLLGAFLGVS